VEKATELGVAQIQPLQCARSVMRLDAERAQRRGVHWQAVAAAAAEQCGRAVVPALAPVSDFTAWCEALPRAAAGRRVLLSLSPAADPVAHVLAGWDGGAAAAGAGAGAQPPSLDVLALSGPEGGLTAQEEAAARAAGFVPVSLGPRVLRADTAPLALLAWLALSAAPSPPPARSA
jgi:16S rRNA (uracil1498-N3)-methyltransferase